jgi:hypothetical protein
MADGFELSNRDRDVVRIVSEDRMPANKRLGFSTIVQCTRSEARIVNPASAFE